MVSAKLRAQALPPKKKKNKAPQAPESADEFLAAGVEEENGGEKWRSGDIIKSTRFFTRALDLYAKGLERFPRDFDLVYNHARLQYDICKQPRLLKAYRSAAGFGPDVNLLQRALEQHEYAYALKQDDTDLNFNLAQLYRDVAESAETDGNEVEALEYLQKALRILEACVKWQVEALAAEKARTEAAEKAAADEVPKSPPDENNNEDTEMGGDDGEAVEDDRWFTEVKPVTAAVLYESFQASMQCITSIIPLAVEQNQPLEHERDLAFAHGSQIVRLWNDSSTSKTEEDWVEEHPRWELDLLIANYEAAELDARFRQSKVSPADYSEYLWGSFKQPEPVSRQWLADSAEADMTFNATLSVLTHGEVDASTIPPLRWKHITRALDSLTTLSKLGADPADIALSLSEVHARRADCELLRRRLCEPENGALQTQKSGQLLATNAEVYYRGAKNLATRDGEDVADFYAREVIASRLAGRSGSSLPDTIQPENVRRNILEMVDEGLVSQQEAMGLFNWPSD